MTDTTRTRTRKCELPQLRPHQPAQAEGLRTHEAALRRHAGRLRASAAALEWPGPRGAALRAEISLLADRCATAANGFALAAAQLDEV
ncbi:hypothetical protein ABZX75_03380 [Streptomyces sp. NPDC003038]|uniref:hypothetical protein n=1 Tax=unclassified Streptomyces TaxID=2593676 RepID=UPI0033B5FB95